MSRHRPHAGTRPSSALGRVLLCSTLLATRSAWGHEFQVHVLEPTDDWCAEAHAVAVPGDVLQLRPGTYPGGCDLTLGGEVELNEALVVQGDPEGGTVIAADPTGLALRVSGEPTRLYLLDLRGRVEVVAPGVTIDRSDVDCLDVAPGLDRFTLVFSTVDDVVLDVGDAVLRGNQLGTVEVRAATGVILENTAHTRLAATVPVNRNLVLGDLEAESDAVGNVVFGRTTAGGSLVHNTLLGPVEALGPTTNNLSVVTELGPDDLWCDDCLVRPELLDVQPTAPVFLHPVARVEPPVEDYCRDAPRTVGAVGSVGAGWTAHDRDLFGCAPDLVAEAPTAPTGTCPLPVTTPEAVDTGLPVGEVVLADDGGAGCRTVPLPRWPFPLVRRRTP